MFCVKLSSQLHDHIWGFLKGISTESFIRLLGHFIICIIKDFMGVAIMIVWFTVQSQFFISWHETRGDTKVQLSEWRKHQIGYVRDLTFITPLKVIHLIVNNDFSSPELGFDEKKFARSSSLETIHVCLPGPLQWECCFGQIVRKLFLGIFGVNRTINTNNLIGQKRQVVSRGSSHKQEYVWHNFHVKVSLMTSKGFLSLYVKVVQGFMYGSMLFAYGIQKLKKESMLANWYTSSSFARGLNIFPGIRILPSLVVVIWVHLVEFNLNLTFYVDSKRLGLQNACAHKPSALAFTKTITLFSTHRRLWTFLSKLLLVSGTLKILHYQVFASSYSSKEPMTKSKFDQTWLINKHKPFVGHISRDIMPLRILRVNLRPSLVKL